MNAGGVMWLTGLTWEVMLYLAGRAMGMSSPSLREHQQKTWHNTNVTGREDTLSERQSKPIKKPRNIMTPNILPHSFFSDAARTLRSVHHHQREGLYHTGFSYYLSTPQQWNLSKSPIAIKCVVKHLNCP